MNLNVERIISIIEKFANTTLTDDEKERVKRHTIINEQNLYFPATATELENRFKEVLYNRYTLTAYDTCYLFRLHEETRTILENRDNKKLLKRFNQNS